MARKVKTSKIRCPKCGRVCGVETDQYIEWTRGMVHRVWKPVCPKAVEIECPDKWCGRKFNLSETS